jgi:hypothetical protein
VEEKEDNEGFNNQNESMNTSYKDVEEEATPTPTDFGACETMEITVHFHNKKINADHIRCFVLESPYAGWNVNFQEDPISSATFICNNKETCDKMAMYCLTKLKNCSKCPFNKISNT